MGDVFLIKPFFRFALILYALALLFLMGIVFWAISSLYLELTEMGPLILAINGAWAIYEGYWLWRWYNFNLTISDDGLKVKEKWYAWSDFKTASAKDAHRFPTFIKLAMTENVMVKVPTVIEQNAFVLSAIENRLSQLERQP